MSRQAIHFYIRKGLVPPGLKRSKTSAEYTEEHIERILLVRRMQEEQFLPLDAIRATFDERDKDFSPPQRRLFADIRRQFDSGHGKSKRKRTLGTATIARRSKCSEKEVIELSKAAKLETEKDSQGRLRIDADDLWLFSVWGELTAIGFGGSAGFRPKSVSIYLTAIQALVQQEAALLASTLEEEDPRSVSKMVERSLPILSTLLAGLHERAIRDFLKVL